MPTNMTDGDLLARLEPVVKENLRRHIAEANDWQPQDFAPFASGRNFAFLGGEDWSPEQSSLGDIEILSATVAVLLADNLPAYHRDLAHALPKSTSWWRWTGRWTSEENRQSIVLRNFLVLTRAVDPVALERVRMEHMTLGFDMPSLHILDVIANQAFDETASMVRHRNSAELGKNVILKAIFERIAQDDELQAKFYRIMVSEAFDIVPDEMMRAIADRVAEFSIPVVDLPGTGNSTPALADAGIYDDDQQRNKVFRPLLQAWNVFGRDNLGDEGKRARDELAALA